MARHLLIAAVCVGLVLPGACGSPQRDLGGENNGAAGDDTSAQAGVAGDQAQHRGESGSDAAGEGGAPVSNGSDTGGMPTAGASGHPSEAGMSGVAGGGAVCGNGKLEAGEHCDDGNKLASDGCSEACAVEAGWICSDAPSVCTHPSCAGLAKTCGPSGNADCCASPQVPGITTATFYRSYDGHSTGYTNQSYPAIVGNFRLDTYEITVGRFRKFVNAPYTFDMTPQGAGKNPNNAADTGWDAANWNASLDANVSALTKTLALCGANSTWTDAPGTAASESHALTCLDWYEAEAFCIWDGGRLPTEAEWNYAAAGGTEQLIYPWGATLADKAHAVYGTPTAAIVGSKSPTGDGKWGQADLSGNVREWVQDQYVNPYPAGGCDNCAITSGSTERSIRGGSYYDNTVGADLLASHRDADSQRNVDTGARCARSAN